MDKNRDIVLQQIANHLITNLNFLIDLSLFQGEIGIFYEYLRSEL